MKKSKPEIPTNFHESKKVIGLRYQRLSTCREKNLKKRAFAINAWDTDNAVPVERQKR